MRFTLPRDIYHGKDSLEALKSFILLVGVVLLGLRVKVKFILVDQ